MVHDEDKLVNIAIFLVSLDSNIVVNGVSATRAFEDFCDLAALDQHALKEVALECREAERIYDYTVDLDGSEYDILAKTPAEAESEATCHHMKNNTVYDDEIPGMFKKETYAKGNEDETSRASS